MNEVLHVEIARLADDLVAWRRDFHRHPELAFHEHRTSRTIQERLREFGIPFKALASTGVRAVIEGRPGGGTVALRADMDALPIQEESAVDYASENPGAMHACGHDGHMAILLGAAKVLAARRESLPGTVVLLFQPSEERLPGGAPSMIRDGALEGVDAIFGLHLWQPLASGHVGLAAGPMMAEPDTFELRVTGRGGHAAMPQQTVDPILAAAQTVINVQSIVSRNRAPLTPMVVSFGSIHGGAADNVIPDEVVLKGTVRTLDDAAQTLAERRLREIVTATAATFGATAELAYRRGYPPLVNDAGIFEIVRAVATRVLGADRVRDIEPVMGGEDFAYYLRQIPGAFVFFGIGSAPYPHHHPRFDIDESVLPDATLLMTATAMELLQRLGPRTAVA